MERVRDYLDDVGFVYIPQRQKEDFLYELSRNRMEFIPMHETELMFYSGGKNLFDSTEKKNVRLEELQGIRLIQNYQDEFLRTETDDKNKFLSWDSLDIAVVTNSDYIMERMLKHTNIANISGSYLSDRKTGSIQGIFLDADENRVIFGYIKHKDNKLEEELVDLIEFLKKELVN